MIKIAPSILSADFGRLAEAARRAQDAGADWIHVDVMDGHFVPNITIGPAMVAALRRATTLPLDVHLMISNPADYIDRFIEAGADYLVVHIESNGDIPAILEAIRKKGVRPGVTLNPPTPVSLIMDLLSLADLVLVMSVNPGFGGQKFIPSALPKLRTLRAAIDTLGREIDLEVDGGINLQTLPDVCRAGANVIVAGSAIYGAADMEETISTFKEMCIENSSKERE